MSMHKELVHLDTSLESVWSLVGFPTRYVEWWPRIIEVRGERFEEGDEFVQVVRTPGGEMQSHFLVEHRDDLRAIRMSCQLTGTYADWLLTPAQGGTFIQLEMGMQPKRFRDRLIDATMGRRYFEAWARASLDALRAATRSAAAK